jgi:U3 small nucleolar RNA-associated protein 15
MFISIVISNPHLQVIAVIEELGKRRGLSIALSNRDEKSLESTLSFTIRFINNPQYTSYLIGVVHMLIDIYGFVVGQSALVDELFDKFNAKLCHLPGEPQEYCWCLFA